ncbi:MAG: FmdB family zinc ribbon protein [Candidatus Zhuqueibacterota bacterium]
MPIYEYRCLSCTRKFEELIRSGERDREITCPGCSGNRVERVMSVFGFASDGVSSASVQSSSCGSCAGGHCSTCH